MSDLPVREAAIQVCTVLRALLPVKIASVSNWCCTSGKSESIVTRWRVPVGAAQL